MNPTILQGFLFDREHDVDGIPVEHIQEELSSQGQTTAMDMELRWQELPERTPFFKSTRAIIYYLSKTV